MTDFDIDLIQNSERSSKKIEKSIQKDIKKKNKKKHMFIIIFFFSLEKRYLNNTRYEQPFFKKI